MKAAGFYVPQSLPAHQHGAIPVCFCRRATQEGKAEPQRSGQSRAEGVCVAGSIGRAGEGSRLRSHSGAGDTNPSAEIGPESLRLRLPSWLARLQKHTGIAPCWLAVKIGVT